MLKPCFLQLQLPTGPRAAMTRNRTWTTKGDLVLRWCLGGVAVAIGAYLRSTSDADQNSDDTWFITAHATIYGEFTQTLPVLQNRTWQWRQQRRKKDKGDSDPQLPMSRVRETIADSCTVSRSETAQMSVWGLHDPRTHMSPPLHQHGPTLEQRFQYLEKWKHTLNRNRASSGLNLRASAAAIWEPLRREEVLPHKKLQL